MKNEGQIPRQPRRDRLIREHVHDPYKTRLKLPEPTVCPQCGAVFHDGRWHWAAKPYPAHEELCQACHRINDHCPAGKLTIAGAFAMRHKDEILHLARHQEEQEKAEHPLHRPHIRQHAVLRQTGVAVGTAVAVGKQRIFSRIAAPEQGDRLAGVDRLRRRRKDPAETAVAGVH